MVEMIVVFLVVAILGVVAVGFSRTTRDRTAGADGDIYAQRVLSAQQSYAASRGTFTGDASDLYGVGRDIVVVNGVTVSPGEVSINVDINGVLRIAAYGTDEQCSVYWVPNPLGGASLQASSWDIAIKPCSATLVLDP